LDKRSRLHAVSLAHTRRNLFEQWSVASDEHEIQSA
jgi:hypothetical protein